MITRLDRFDWAAAAVIVAALAYALTHPLWDWDAIPYLFLAKRALGAGVAEAHAWTYTHVAAMGEQTWRTMAGVAGFAQQVAVDPEGLRQVSGFYAERAGYYSLLAVLVALGIPALAAMQGISMAGTMVLAGTLWMWLRAFNARGWWKYSKVAALFIVMFFPSLMEGARWSGPAGMVAGLFLLGFYSLLRRRDWAWLLAWGGMVACRPMTAVWLLPLGIYFMANKDWQRAWLLGCVLALAAMLHGVWPGYGLMLAWHQTFVGAYAYPEVLQLPFSWDFYREWLRVEFGALHGREAVMFLGLWLALGVIGWRGGAREVHIAAAVGSGVMLQILLMPDFAERLYVGPVLGLGLLAASCLAGGNWGKAYLLGTTNRRLRHRTL